MPIQLDNVLSGAALNDTDAEWLRNRRRIRSFFFQEVDRDKLILAGGDLEVDEYK